LRLAAEYYPTVGRPWHFMEHRSSTDNYLGDPSIGIPTVMPNGGYGVLAHHNSADVMATIDPKSERDLIVMNAAYTYFIAAAGPAEKRWMAELALTRGYGQVTAAAEKTLDEISIAKDAESLSRLLFTGQERVAYSLDRETQAVKSAWNLQDGLAALQSFADNQKSRVDRMTQDRATALGLPKVQPFVPARNLEAEKIIVKRKRMGTITMDNLPREQREGFPASTFWGVPTAALYWCDGKRNLAEVIRLTNLEMGPQQMDFVAYFRFLEKQGYVEFVQ
jgi:hypothetical protein